MHEEMSGPTLNETQAKQQVVEPAHIAVKALGLNVVLASYELNSCNDQGDPPFHGSVDVTFDIPKGMTADSLKNKVLEQLSTQGWGDGPGSGKVVFGTSASKGEMLALLSTNGDESNYPNTVSLAIDGECRSPSDYGTSIGKITDEFH